MHATRPDGQDNSAEAADNRASRRQRTLKAALAAFNNECSTIPCVVRNLSETGARLVFEKGAAPPAHFVLHIELDGYKVDCERVWQKGNEWGVRFVSDKRPTRVHRSQVVNTSENALSEAFKRDLALRERQLQPEEPQPKEIEPRPGGLHRPVFGKRGH
jgi:hypothetical protein